MEVLVHVVETTNRTMTHSSGERGFSYSGLFLRVAHCLLRMNNATERQKSEKDDDAEAYDSMEQLDNTADIALYSYTADVVLYSYTADVVLAVGGAYYSSVVCVADGATLISNQGGALYAEGAIALPVTLSGGALIAS